jgi:hypothetical protein
MRAALARHSGRNDLKNGKMAKTPKKRRKHLKIGKRLLFKSRAFKNRTKKGFLVDFWVITFGIVRPFQNNNGLFLAWI